MIAPDHRLPVTRQCRLLGLSRSSVYYRKRPVPEGTLALMRRMDEVHLDYPFFGSRGLKKHLCREGWQVGRERVARLMKLMGMEALYQKPNSSKRHPKHPVYPYLLRGVVINRSNQVWAADITYIPMKRGFIFLFVVMDWASRKVLAWRLSNTLTTDFCMEAVNEATCIYGIPEIFNTDQGCQFTSQDFTDLLKQNAIAISMDGKGCWRDNIFVERLWRTVKYEEVYLHAYDSVSEARKGLEKYFMFYNQKRSHTTLDDKTPDEFYLEKLPKLHCVA